MGFSILPTLAAYSAPNLTIVVLDNGQHASADQVPSQAATLELAGAAEGLGLNTIRCSDQTGLEAALAKSAKENVFAIIFAKIEPGNSVDIPLLLADPAVLAMNFANFIASSTRP
jgi:thiamine pyrophosphate-dependent acetolactate synthase large subunit-like protein